jgi:glutaredoxin 2
LLLYKVTSVLTYFTLQLQQANKITKNGDFIVTSEKTRKQILNQADCLDKIRHMIFQASILPKELTPEQKAVIEKRYNLTVCCGMVVTNKKTEGY